VVQNFVLLILILVQGCESDHSNPSNPVRELLDKDEGDILQLLQKTHTDLSWAASQIEVPVENTRRDEAQIVALLRALLEVSGGRVDCRQHEFDQEYGPSDNASLFCSIIGITLKSPFVSLDPNQLHIALSKSKVFTEDNSVPDMEERSRKMMLNLHVGFPEGYLVQYPDKRA
jgi:hypothetical protein